MPHYYNATARSLPHRFVAVVMFIAVGQHGVALQAAFAASPCPIDP
jgi:hypothetical protein